MASAVPWTLGWICFSFDRNLKTEACIAVNGQQIARTEIINRHIKTITNIAINNLKLAVARLILQSMQAWGKNDLPVMAAWDPAVSGGMIGARADALSWGEGG